MEPETCLVDSAATHSILRETKYFTTLRKRDESILTIAGSNGRIVGSGQATVVLPMGTRIFIQEAFLYPSAERTLLTFKDIRRCGYHLTTTSEGGEEFLLMTFSKDDETAVVQKMPRSFDG